MAEKCSLCGRNLNGFLVKTVTCKKCRRVVCGNCQKDGICTICRQREEKAF